MQRTTFQAVLTAFKKAVEDYSFENILPSGSGFDADWDVTVNNSDEIVLTSGYHLMNDIGYYVGWFNFKVKVCKTADGGFDLAFIEKAGTVPDEETQDYILDEIYQSIIREVE